MEEEQSNNAAATRQMPSSSLPPSVSHSSSRLRPLTISSRAARVASSAVFFFEFGSEEGVVDGRRRGAARWRWKSGKSEPCVTRASGREDAATPPSIQRLQRLFFFLVKSTAPSSLSPQPRPSPRAGSPPFIYPTINSKQKEKEKRGGLIFCVSCVFFFLRSAAPQASVRGIERRSEDGGGP